jgi:CSLREA domain-containing protein
MKRNNSFIGINSVFASTVFFCIFFSHSVHAVNFVVTRTDDPTPNGCNSGDCSLREAIIASNANPQGSNTIALQAATYELTLQGAGENGAATGDLDIGDGDNNDQAPNVTILGVSADTTIIDAAGLHDRIFDIVDVGAIVNLTQLTLQNGDAGAADGGAIAFGVNGGFGSKVTFSDSRVIGNHAANGGAVRACCNAPNGSVNLLRTVFFDNSASADGGALYVVNNIGFNIQDSTIDMNQAGNNGGGIFTGSTSTVVSLVNSTLSNNEAGASGGGLFYQSGNPAVHADNSTFSGNQATTGAAVSMSGLTDFRFRNVTITNNTSSGQGAGIYIPGGLTDSTIANSIVAHNISLSSIPSPDCFIETGVTAGFTSLGHNIFGGVASCSGLSGPGDLSGVGDPGLGPLADNGGPTLTHLLLGGSPAFNHGNPAGCLDSDDVLFTEDQRGQSRPQDGICDSGSVETASAAIDVIPLSIDFGDIALGVPNTKNITIANTGDRTLNVSGMNLSNTTDYAIDPGTCGGLSFSLDSGDSCVAEVTFMPQAQGGPFNATLTIASNDVAHPSTVVNLTGVGVQAPGGGICGDAICAVGETCACADCQNLPSCQPGGGGTCGDGICSVTEDCTCQDCANDDTCQSGGGGICGDGICAVNEDCTCADCSGDPTCQTGGGGSCGDGICAVGETCDCQDCKNVDSCKVGSQGGSGGGGGCSLRADSSLPSSGGMGLLLLPLLLAAGRILRRAE